MSGEQEQVLERLNWINERAKSIDARLLGLRDDVQDLTHTLKTAFDLIEKRTECGKILAGLKARGVITQAIVERLEAKSRGDAEARSRDGSGNLKLETWDGENGNGKVGNDE